MTKDDVVRNLTWSMEWVKTHNVLALKIAFLIAMMLIGHHRGLFPFHPVKIPIAHGINQILGAVVWTAIGVAVLVLTNKLFGW